MVHDEELSGVELLALYGDDDRIGAFLPGLRRGVKKAWGMTPQGYALNKLNTYRKKHRRIHGDDDRIGAFLPGLKNVGKVTSSFTTGIAKSFVPPYLVDALSKVDPTKKGASASKALVAINTADKKPIAVPAKIMGVDTKKIAIIGGGAVGALILLKLLLGAPRHS